MTGVEGYVLKVQQVDYLLESMRARLAKEWNQSSFHRKQLLEAWLITLLMRKETFPTNECQLRSIS